MLCTPNTSPEIQSIEMLDEVKELTLVKLKSRKKPLSQKESDDDVTFQIYETNITCQFQ